MKDLNNYWLVYLITREDNLQYVGTTSFKNYKRRMIGHSNSKRFKGYNIISEILCMSKDKSFIYDLEETMISIYDTFYNGLNSTKNGKCNFTFHYYKHIFTNECRMKMSKKAKDRYKNSENHPFKNNIITQQKRENLIIGQKKRNRRLENNFAAKISLVDFENIINDYINKKELPKNYNDNIGVTAKNGKKMTYMSEFCKYYATLYNITKEGMRGIIKTHEYSLQ